MIATRHVFQHSFRTFRRQDSRRQLAQFFIRRACSAPWARRRSRKPAERSSDLFVHVNQPLAVLAVRQVAPRFFLGPRGRNVSRLSRLGFDQPVNLLLG
ncbi:MAG TPA: hypothetical protein VKG84_01530 [Candidatus Acidoferrales bacterium]|nr:hypothetical protein [Candidatus Acidoferrales bacterium]